MRSLVRHARPGSVLSLFLALICSCAAATNPARTTRARGVTIATNASASQPAAAVTAVGNVEVVAKNDGPLWTGVTVSRSGRIFVCFPRWGDNVGYTVGELKNGRTTAYPDAGFNHFDSDSPVEHLIAVQSVVVDPLDRLWMLDTGSVEMRPPAHGGAKLVAVDLSTNQVVKSIVLPADVALPTTYINDVRFNLRQGRAGMAYITDSGERGPNGIIVVDIDSQQTWRRLSGHPSVRPQPGFTAIVEGKAFTKRPAPGIAEPITVGADGIAISADGKTLFYSPMSSRHLYGVSTAALSDRGASDEEVANSVVDYGDRGYASDGLEADAAGHLYLSDYEHNAVHRWTFGPAGPADITDEVIAQGHALVWPDTLSVASDGYLYFTVNQLSRQKQYNEGVDLRQKPYLLLRTRIGGGNQK